MEKQINVNLNALQEMHCPRCNSKHFIKTHILKIIPALIAGNPRAQLAAIELFACSNCFWVITDEDVADYKEGKFSDEHLRAINERIHSVIKQPKIDGLNRMD